MSEPRRCQWAKSNLEIAYHDNEWGKPLHDERRLFEMLILEGMQAGLSWSLILRRREALREAFDRFDPEVVAQYSDEKLAALLDAPGMIRNKLKIKAARTNAQAFLRVQQEFGSFDKFIWSFIGGEVVVNHPSEPEDIPASDEISARMSKELKKRGFSFVGPTICYALMQSIGMVNDHMVWCDFRE